MDTHDRLFDNTHQFLSMARNRRRKAIDAHPRLAYAVRLRDLMGGEKEIVFDTSSELDDIRGVAQAAGILGQVQILDVTVRTTKPRPLLLQPWARPSAGQSFGVAAK